MAILPPGVSAESFASAVREFEAAVGRQWVFTSDEDLHSYRDFVLRRFHETLKDAIDPNGVLSPGRGGIWPAAHRWLRGALRS